MLDFGEVMAGGKGGGLLERNKAAVFSRCLRNNSSIVVTDICILDFSAPCLASVPSPVCSVGRHTTKQYRWIPGLNFRGYDSNLDSRRIIQPSNAQYHPHTTTNVRLQCTN